MVLSVHEAQPRVDLAALAACGACQPRSGAAPQDEWFSAPPAQVQLDAARGPPESFRVVRSEARDEARARLATAAAVVLPPDALRGYVDDPPRVDGARPFLVRGLGRGLATCKWNITRSGWALVVQQGCLAKDDVPLERRPVVVWLRDAPAIVYVGASLAE
jgi:hypothetical protein